MARFASLVMAGMVAGMVGMLVCSAGCMGGRWVGAFKPPLPQPLGLDAYAQVQPVVATPGLEDGRVAIGGGRIDDHGVYIDVLVEVPREPGFPTSIDEIADAGYEGDASGERWFTLTSGDGEAVRMVPRERPRWRSRSITMCSFGFGHFDRLNAAPDRSRYTIVVWYRTQEQLRPGTYILHVPNIFDEYPGIYREQLGLKAFDNTPIELRYADGFRPAAAGG